MSVLLAADTFDRTASTTNPGSTDGAGLYDPLAWNAQRGTWGITAGGTLYCPTVSGSSPFDAFITIPLGEADVDFTFTASWTGTPASMSVILRLTDLSNYLKLVCDNTQMVFEKIVADAHTSILSTTGPVVSGDIIRIIASGANYATFQNGSLQATGRDTTWLTQTDHGFWTNTSGGKARANDLSIVRPSKGWTVGQIGFPWSPVTTPPAVDARITEAGDTRITEAGDRRIVE